MPRKANEACAMFIIRTELYIASSCLDKNGNKDTPLHQFLIPQNLEPDQFHFAEVNEFSLPKLNVEITRAGACSTITDKVDDSVEEIEGNEGGGNIASGSVNADDNVNVPDHKNNIVELEFDVNDDQFNFNNEEEWDTGLDKYQFGDSSMADSEVKDKNVQVAACKFERNSGRFKFTFNSKNFMLRIRKLFKTVDEF